MHISFYFCLSLFAFPLIAKPLERHDSLSITFGETSLNHTALVTYTEVTAFLTTSFENHYSLKQNSPLIILHYHSTINYFPWILGINNSLFLHRIQFRQNEFRWPSTGAGNLDPVLITKYHAMDGLSVLAGRSFFRHWQGFASVGPALALFHSNSNQGTQGSGGALGLSGKLNKFVPGIQWGLTLLFSMDPHWQIRGDYSAFRFSFNKQGEEPGTTIPVSSIYGFTDTKYRISTHNISIGLAYLFS
jgi:hypothetical protein